MTEALATLFATIPLTQRKVAIIDEGDYPILSKYKWFATRAKCGLCYACCDLRVRKKGSLTRMHRFIMNPPAGMEVDHINGDGLDNRRENLRLVSHRENSQNRHDNTSSKHPGVCWDKQKGKWVARIRIKGKYHFIGYFIVEDDAGAAYVKACENLLKGGQS